MCIRDRPNPVDPIPVIISNIAFSVEAAATLTYHWVWSPSHWIGCPISPEFLSDTLLTTFKRPPLLLIAIGSPSTESLKVLATWILRFVVTPVALVLLSVIAK